MQVDRVRTQIQLTEEQSRRLKAASARRGISVAEFIRKAVDAVLTRENDRSPDDLYDRALNAAEQGFTVLPAA
jgi:hypothetical protein